MEYWTTNPRKCYISYMLAQTFGTALATVDGALGFNDDKPVELYKIGAALMEKVL